MNKSESIINLVQATLKVMSEVKGIDKTMQIGTGNGSYKGVPDQEVKKIIGESMQKNGLAIFPVSIEENTQLSEWDETSQYGVKRKQSVFTKVKTTYLLAHSSGEFITLAGYGHGVDTQDKGAGKATTYALKYTLLYSFLIPTGKIDDADATHSDNIEVPAKTNGNVPDEKMLIQAMTDLENCKTIEQVTTIWNKYQKLHSTELFVKEVSRLGKKFKPVTA